MISEISRETDSYQKTHSGIDEINLRVGKAISDFPEQRDLIMEVAGAEILEIIRDYYHSRPDELRDIVNIRFGNGEYDTFDAHIRIGAIYYACAPRPAMKERANKLWFRYGNDILSKLPKGNRF